MAKEFLDGEMEGHIEDSGLMENKMEEVTLKLSGLKLSKWENGTMESEQNGYPIMMIKNKL